MRFRSSHSCFVFAGVLAAAGTPARAEDISSLDPPPTPVQSRRFAVRARLAANSPEAAQLMLWYTRDRGQTWQPGPSSVAGKDYVVFEAKSEGLYGFFLTASSPSGAGTQKPAAGTAPQRWVFVDATPPLAQWKGADLVTDGSGVRRVVMDWTAHDANFGARPVALAYQPAGQSQWQTIDAALPNTGRYDWTPPSGVRGRITLRLSVRDLGGHTVDRLFGPISVEPEAAPAATRPAENGAVQASPSPRETPEAGVPTDPAARARAQRLYEQGAWHVDRGQYAEARERFLEALQLDASLTPARVDLAGALYALGRYDESIEQYKAALQQDASRATALKGLALAYVARREYVDARKTLERLLLTDGRNVEAWLHLGDVAYRMGDRDGARQFWSKAGTISPDARDIVLKAQNRLSLFPAAATGAEKGK